MSNNIVFIILFILILQSFYLSMTDVINTNNDVIPTQYSVRLVASSRDFVTNTSDTSLGIWILQFNNPSEFVPLIWERSVGHIHRGVIVNSILGGSIECTWMTGPPIIQDIHLYVGLHDSTGHRSIEEWWTNITGQKIRSFEDKEIKLHVYKYSSNIKNKATFVALSKQLLQPRQTDRGGAATTNLLNSLVERLKETHSQNFSAFDINWMQWATDIQSQPLHLHDNLIQRGPPTSLVHLFRSRSTPAEVSLSNLNRANRIGLGMVQNILAQIPEIRNVFMVGIARLDALTQQLQNYQQQFEQTIEVTAPVQETQSSRDIFDRVINAEDVDHMDTNSDQDFNV
jgi:hypothetical protein